MTTGEGTHDIGTLRENMAIVQRDIALMWQDMKRILKNFDDNGRKGLVSQTAENTSNIKDIDEKLDAHILEHRAREKETREFWIRITQTVVGGVILMIVTNVITVLVIKNLMVMP